MMMMRCDRCDEEEPTDGADANRWATLTYTYGAIRPLSTRTYHLCRDCCTGTIEVDGTPLDPDAEPVPEVVAGTGPGDSGGPAIKVGQIWKDEAGVELCVIDITWLDDRKIDRVWFRGRPSGDTWVGEQQVWDSFQFVCDPVDPVDPGPPTSPRPGAAEASPTDAELMRGELGRTVGMTDPERASASEPKVVCPDCASSDADEVVRGLCCDRALERHQEDERSNRVASARARWGDRAPQTKSGRDLVGGVIHTPFVEPLRINVLVEDLANAAAMALISWGSPMESRSGDTVWFGAILHSDLRDIIEKAIREELRLDQRGEVPSSRGREKDPPESGDQSNSSDEIVKRVVGSVVDAITRYPAGGPLDVLVEEAVRKHVR